LKLKKAIDRMEATIVAPVRAVRPARVGAASLRWPMASVPSVSGTFEAPTEEISAGLWF
jgi:hypothetical protein